MIKLKWLNDALYGDVDNQHVMLTVFISNSWHNVQGEPIKTARLWEVYFALILHCTLLFCPESQCRSSLHCVSKKSEFLISQGSVATCLRWGGFCSKFHTLCSSAKILKIGQDLTNLQSLKLGNFLRHSVYAGQFSVRSVSKYVQSCWTIWIWICIMTME